MLSHAIIPAAGLATRFLPASKSVPKESFPLYDRPVIQHIAEEAAQAGIHNIVVVTSEGKEAITDHFDRINPKFLQGKIPDEIGRELERLEDLAEVIAVRQKSQKGLGHAVLRGMTAVPTDPFAVMLPDMFIVSRSPDNVMVRMKHLYEQHDRPVIALMRVPDEDRKRYGMAEGEQRDGFFEIGRLVEKPGVDGTASNLAIVGRYLLPGAIGPILEKTRPGAKGEIQLTDALNTLCGKQPILGLVLRDDDLVFDAGDKDGYAYANAYLAAKRIPGFLDAVRRMIS